jgi:alpha-tubulin suppressor-like RCC1 family protein
VIKIVSGYRHNLAITDKGRLFGWGYNNQQQLSHSDEYALEENPWHAIFTPMPITKELEGKRVVDAAAGEEFSLILVENPANNNVQEVYGCGNNLRGQLGINRTSHVQDMILVEDISGFVDMYASNQPLRVSNLTCGKRHCVATFNYGAFFVWGDNEFGQLGDKKRRFLESPFPKSKFERRHNVEHVVCGIDNCAVIVEDLSTAAGAAVPKKRKKADKRTIKKAQMVTSAEELKALSEQRIVNKDPEAQSEVKRSLSERVKEKW